MYCQKSIKKEEGLWVYPSASSLAAVNTPFRIRINSLNCKNIQTYINIYIYSHIHRYPQRNRHLRSWKTITQYNYNQQKILWRTLKLSYQWFSIVHSLQKLRLASQQNDISPQTAVYNFLRFGVTRINEIQTERFVWKLTKFPC